MSERVPGERVRVVIAGNIYAKRALVKRFLEDDGFDVAAEAMSRSELFAALRLHDPDAVVVDDDLIGGDIAAIREIVPDTRIVVFTSGRPEPSRVSAGADGYLEKGVGLASLTAMLQALVIEPTAPTPVFQTSPGPLVAIPIADEPLQERRIVMRLGALAAALALVAAGTLVLLGSPQKDAQRVIAAPTGQPPGSNPAAGAPTALDAAFTDLHELRSALSGGYFVYAGVVANALVTDRAQALEVGFAVGALDAQIRAALRPLMGSIPPRFLSVLQSIMGDLLPPPPPLSSGGETGETAPAGAGGGTTSSGGGGTSTGGGGTSTGGGGTSTGGGGGGGGGGEGTSTPSDTSPGNGKHKGWENKPPGGGWHGENPKRHGPPDGNSGKKKK